MIQTKPVIVVLHVEGEVFFFYIRSRVLFADVEAVSFIFLNRLEGVEGRILDFGGGQLSLLFLLIERSSG